MLKKVFNGVFLKRLDNIIQWQDKDVIFKESVSSHSYKVSVFCTLVLDEIFGEENNKEDVVNFKLKCIKHAIFHDWDEALIMRDISHETKYNSFNGKEIRACLNNLSKEFSKREFLNEGKIKTVYNAMNESNEAVHAVVKFCDWLAMIFYLDREESSNVGETIMIFTWSESEGEFKMFEINGSANAKVFPVPVSD